MEGEILVKEKTCYHDSRHDPGNQGGDGNALHAAVETKYEYRIAGYIDPIHQDGNFHGDGRISLHAENRRSGIVYGDKWDRGSHDHQIGVRISHDIRFDLPKYDMEDKPFAQIDGQHDQE